MNEPLRKREAIYILIILVLIAGTFWYGKNEGKKAERLKQENQLLQQEIQSLRQQIDTAKVRINEVQIKRVSERLEFEAREGALKSKIQAIQKTRFVIREQIQPIIDSSAVVRAYVEETDQLVDAQDKLIQELTISMDKAGDSFRKEIGLLNEKVTATEAISELYRKGYESQAKQVKKERRGKKFFRTLSVGLGVALGVVILTSQ